ncbi:MAG: peptidyl-prolyl cis-trans isomerase B [Actinobacteria bacterium]|nr:MAG: peptidyl-prolyl cis-trans isomerase B [Actinomycetota bacterium]
MQFRSSARVALLVATVLTLGVMGLQGCSGTPAGQKSDKVDASAPSQENTQTATESAATQEEDGMHVSDEKVTGTEVAIITTPKGVIKFEFYGKDAPNHVASFIELARAGFYDGTTFHRVEPGFVIQGGDPNTKTGNGPAGTGGPGYNLKAEFNSRPHLDGTVSMARSQSPDSAGSQFYICLGPQPFLDGQYTVFGQVTEGMDVVRAIKAGDVMESVRIEDGN